MRKGQPLRSQLPLPLPLLLLGSGVFAVAAEPNGLGITPPMGWNPYNAMKASNFKWFPNETMLHAQAIALKETGLQVRACREGAVAGCG